jgi:hypothetical protein
MPEDVKAFFKVFAGVVGTLGGFAALFIAFGYITVQSFLSNMKLYGLAYFPVQFYKEATVTFLRDVFSFYSGKPHFAPVAISICLLPFLFLIMKRFKLTFLRNILAVFSIVFAATVVFITFTLGILRTASLERTVFNAVSLPALLALFLYLAGDFHSFDSKEPFKNLYSPFVLIFIFLFLSIPVGYGSYLYDITVFTVSVPECSSKDTAFNMFDSKRYRLLYLMGHTSEREIFFDATAPPISVILVDKKLINSIRVDFSKVQTQTLRALYDVSTRDYLDKAMKDQEMNIPGEVERLENKQLKEWMQK